MTLLGQLVHPDGFARPPVFDLVGRRAGRWLDLQTHEKFHGSTFFVATRT